MPFKKMIARPQVTQAERASHRRAFLRRRLSATPAQPGVTLVPSGTPFFMMTGNGFHPFRGISRLAMVVLAGIAVLPQVNANPVGPTVGQGSVSFNTSGSTFTVNQSSANAFVNWQSFNIGAGETTTFVQPSASSVIWNQINDANASQILGNLNANGYVILQNQNGFAIGGSAVLTAHGLILTTSPTPAPNLSDGGAWTFNSPPPSAKIVNLGQINITGGGSAYLIASDIKNDNSGTVSGTISAPGGKIGLYDGQKVLVSMSPDGRGLSAQVTLPAGSVDNEGRLIADAGSIAAQAQTVNQNGLAQANSVQNNNGVIELVAGDNLTLGANSDIEANGDGSAGSPGGFVVLQAGNTYADTATSKINVSGQTTGQDGILEFFGNNLVDATSLQSVIGNNFATFINPFDLTLSGNPTDPSAPNVNVADLAPYSQIDLHALDNIELSTPLSLNDASAPAAFSLSAGNNITLDDGTGITAGKNWSVNLAAGTGFAPTVAQPTPAAGNDGIYLTSSAYVQTQDGDINLSAANEVQVTAGGNQGDAAGSSGIRTLNGGSISVNTTYGDVNAGVNPLAYQYSSTAPYYTVATDLGASLGGISTAAGGNVSINAGGNVFSFLPTGNSSFGTAADDGGSGAFGPEAGNVTINAGGNIYGHYVLANGVGSITASQNVGGTASHSFALSLVAGSWSISAPNGSIYLQEVRNPNGVFNSLGSVSAPGHHLFDYAPDATVNLDANAVYLTGANVPRPAGAVPVLYPPILDITAGSGGVTLDDNVTLFPSADQNLAITTTDGGNLTALPAAPGTAPIELLMSDSAQTKWKSAASFSDNDHGAVPEDLNNLDPVQISIDGNMENLVLLTSRATTLTVQGDMINCGFSGENLHASDITSLHVTGQIYNQSAYAFVNLPTPIPAIAANDLLPGMASSWMNIFSLALDPTALANLTIPPGILPSQLVNYIVQQTSLFSDRPVNGVLTGSNPGFVYNQATGQLGFGGPMPQSILSEFSQPLTVLHLGADGLPVTYTGGDGKTHFETDQVNWAAPAAVETLYTDSQADPSTADEPLGYRIGGPGEFDVDAGSISLGNTYGILSCGVQDPQGGFNRYNNLASITPSGATLNVTVNDDQSGTEVVDGTTIQSHDSLNLLTSTIASLGGGDVNVISTAGSMDLGSEALQSSTRNVGFGVFTAGAGNVNVMAQNNVEIDGSRIAAYNGGNIFVESYAGNVDVGAGGDTTTGVEATFVNPATKKADNYQEIVFGSGIVANTYIIPPKSTILPPNAAKLPGNITIKTPQGNITSQLGGITQVALDGTTTGGPTITLEAGTFPTGTIGQPGYSPGYPGNIELGQSGGVIGGTINASANGDIQGAIISRQNSNVQAAQNFSGAVVAGGGANVSGGGTVSGVIVGVGGASVSGGSVSAEVLGQNVSVNGGAAQSTLGSSASATSTSQSAAQQSSNDTKQELADNSGSDDEKKKKKTLPLMQRVKRVTVILPKA